MIRPALLLCAALLAASSALAQTAMPPVRQIQIQPIQPATPAEPAAPTVAPSVESAADPAQLVDRTAILEAQNKRLREENATLKQQLAELTSHGGSQVHAYCANPNTSRSTAGDEANCAASGNTCESVSGLCRTTCQTSDMCAGGYTCDTGTQQCVYTAGGVPDSDG